MNIATLMTRIAALQGHPIPVSSSPAPLDARESEVIRASTDDQLPRARGVRSSRNVEFARFEGAKRNGADLVLRMDILAPSAPGRHPLVVYVPGGGFVFAVKAGGAAMRRYVAAAGYVVASVEYRTTRHGATWIEGVADVRAAIRYLRAHSGEYGIDASRVGVWGESAGGYIASMVGLTAGDSRFDASGPPVLAVVNKFGGSALDRLSEGFDDAAAAATYAAGNPLARYVHGGGAQSIDDDPDRLHASDPSSYASPGAPPFLMFHGADDRLVSPVQTALLHHALRFAGADSTRYVVIGAGHGDIAIKGGEEKYWTTRPMMQLIIDFLGRTLA